MERTEDSGDEELSYIPGSPDDDPLFQCLEQQGDILPINIIVPMKSRFTILFIRCARTGYR
jgi:hypothetical protein